MNIDLFLKLSSGSFASERKKSKSSSSICASSIWPPSRTWPRPPALSPSIVATGDTGVLLGNAGFGFNVVCLSDGVFYLSPVNRE